MSNVIFPNYLPGILFTPKKSPTFNTGVHPAVTGKESRLSYRAYPLYQWELSYELLRDYADGRANFVPYSQDLTHWTIEHGGTGFQPVLVPNSVLAPDGTLTADRLILNQNTASGGNFSQTWISVAPAPLNTTYTYSIWAKTNDGSTKTVQLIVYNGAGGVGFTGFATVTGTWQRYSVTTGAVFNAIGAVQRVYFALNGASTSAYGDFAVWGAQLEIGAAATGYIPTNGAAVVTGDLKTMFGLFSQMLGQQDTFLYQDPDFNTVSLQQFLTGNGSITSWPLTAQYMPGNDFIAPFGLAGLPELIQSTNGSPQIYTLRYGAQELLSSGSRTNLALQSTMGATWTANLITITASSTTSPDGAVHGTQLTDNTTVGVHWTGQTGITITASGRYTFSVFLKYSNHQYASVFWDSGGGDGVAVNVDLVNNVIGNVLSLGTSYFSNYDATITTGFANGWVRVSISGQLPAADTSARLGVAFVQNLTTPPWSASYAGTGTDVLFVWGGQFEAGNTATALIPTTTTSATNGGSDYSIGATNIVTPASTLASGVSWAWSGSFYYRNRFGDDSMDFDEFLYQFWELKTLKMQQVKL